MPKVSTKDDAKEILTACNNLRELGRTDQDSLCDFLSERPQAVKLLAKLKPDYNVLKKPVKDKAKAAARKEQVQQAYKEEAKEEVKEEARQEGKELRKLQRSLMSVDAFFKEGQDRVVLSICAPSYEVVQITDDKSAAACMNEYEQVKRAGAMNDIRNLYQKAKAYEKVHAWFLKHSGNEKIEQFLKRMDVGVTRSTFYEHLRIANFVDKYPRVLLATCSANTIKKAIPVFERLVVNDPEELNFWQNFEGRERLVFVFKGEAHNDIRPSTLDPNTVLDLSEDEEVDGMALEDCDDERDEDLQHSKHNNDKEIQKLSDAFASMDTDSRQ